jgi:hypothetical protein
VKTLFGFIATWPFVSVPELLPPWTMVSIERWLAWCLWQFGTELGLGTAVQVTIPYQKWPDPGANWCLIFNGAYMKGRILQLMTNSLPNKSTPNSGTSWKGQERHRNATSHHSHQVGSHHPSAIPCTFKNVYNLPGTVMPLIANPAANASGLPFGPSKRSEVMY